MPSPNPAPDAPSARAGRGAALLILVVALGLRLLSVGYGLDLEDRDRAVHNVHLDERAMVLEEVGLLQGDWHPGDFLMRGTGPFYVAGAVNAATLGLVSTLSGTGWESTVARQAANPSLVFYVHRLLAVLAGTLTVLVVLRTCRRELGADTGTAAGLLLASAYMHVQISHYGLVDVPWVLFAMLAVDRALCVARAPRRRDYLLAGLWIGLAGAMKYPGALSGATLLAAHWSAVRGARRDGSAGPPLRWFGATVGLSVLTFLALSPRLFVAPMDYVEAMRTQARILDIVERSSAYGSVLWRHLENSLWVGLGEPVAVLAAVGLVVGLARGGAARRLALFALLFVPTALVAKDPAPRFATGLLVAAVPLAAIGFDALASRASVRLREVLLVLVLLPSLTRTLATDVVLREPDTRPEMLAVIDALEVGVEDVVAIGHRGLPKATGRPEPFTSLLRELRDEVRDGPASLADVVAKVHAAPPPFVLRDLSSGVPDAVLWEPFRELVEREYEEVFRVDGRRVPLPEPRPQGTYLVPRNYVPFRAPWAARRPGPALVLYRRRPADG